MLVNVECPEKDCKYNVPDGASGELKFWCHRPQIRLMRLDDDFICESYDSK
jgi:hypothetical protein